ncbi:TIGR03668 family PPOX class F420-dependent oxidoreductase [Streptomyces abikoensis]|uniref:TIGR03668 family PPOX class F420-dependent oxidoreductase n=1 Tax=Streptomyces abikoensis TaxID=97398 RepID=UPI0033EE0007
MRLGPEDSRARFAASPVARLATAGASGAPHLVPVTFALDGDTLYFAIDHKPKSTQNLRRLRNIKENPQVSALVDHYADDWHALWWARADGHARIRTDPEHRETAIALLQAKYPQYVDHPPEGPVVAMEIDRWSGWAFRS